MLSAWVEKKFDVDEHEGDPWVPSIGEIVIHNKEGTFGKIIKIKEDGTYETQPVSIEEVKIRYPGIKVG